MGAAAPQGDFDVIHLESFGKFAGLERALFGDIDIEDFAANFAGEMPMFAHVRAKANRRAIEDHLADEAAFDKEAQAIINGGKGDFGIRFFSALEDLLRSWMIVAIRDHVEDLLALTGHTQAAIGELVR